MRNEILLSSLLRLLVGSFLLSLAGCASVKQDVTITTVPPGARIEVDGQEVGVSPVTVELTTREAHAVTASLPGFHPTNRVLHSVPNDASGNFVRFGLLDAAGGYRELETSSLHLELTSSLVPQTRGIQPFEDLASRIVQADDLLADGRITPEIHRLIVGQLLALYQ
jgi:hypothetical protein